MKRILFILFLGSSVLFSQNEDSLVLPKHYPIFPSKGKNGALTIFKVTGKIIEETKFNVYCGVNAGYSTIKIEVMEVDSAVYTEKYMYMIIFCYMDNPDHIGKTIETTVSLITLDRDLKYGVNNTLNSNGQPFFYCEKYIIR